MKSTRMVSILAFGMGTAGLSLLVIDDSVPLVILGAALVSGAAILMSRHFWRLSTRRRADERQATARAIENGIGGLRKEISATNSRVDSRADSLTKRVDTFAKGVLEYVSQVELDVRRMSKEVDKTLTKSQSTLTAMERNERRADRRRDDIVRELGGIVGVYETLEPSIPYPPFGGWAIDGECARELVALVLTNRPECIVEIGSGTSTVLAAQSLILAGVPGKVFSLEHEQVWAEKTRQLVEDHGVSHLCEIVHAPLVETTVGDATYRWYDLEGVDLPEAIDLLFVDGPPKSTGDLARYPALPLLHDHMSPGAVVLLDDAARPDEREMLDRWSQEYPNLNVNLRLGSKGIAVITNGAT